MIAVLDSGAGGLVSFRHLRELCPRADIIYLADRKNAPYGTRSEGEILGLCKINIGRLLDMGCELVLLACCTASTVHGRLPRELQKRSLPIITPAAKECEKSRRVVVIATEHTVKSGAFGREIQKYSSASVIEIPMQPLVSLIEWGRDTSECVSAVAKHLRDFNADTLILGCTHFSHLKEEFETAMQGIKIISPAHLGAEIISKKIIDRGKGQDIYTS